MDCSMGSEKLEYIRIKWSLTSLDRDWSLTHQAGCTTPLSHCQGHRGLVTIVQHPTCSMCSCKHEYKSRRMMFYVSREYAHSATNAER